MNFKTAVKNIATCLTLLTLIFMSYSITAFTLPQLEYQTNSSSIASLDLDWWPMYRHDSSNIGYSTNTPPTSADLLWTFQANDAISSSPAVVHGKVYVGSWDFTLYCFDMETGAVLWEYQTGGRITSSPTVVDNRVYFGSRDSRIYCLDTNNGSLLWEYQTGYYIESSPTIQENKLYIGSADGNFYCLNALDGTLLWSFPTNNIIWSSPAISQGYVYFGSLSGVFYCLDSITGALIWQYTTGSGIWASPAIYNGRVFIGSNDKNLYCFDAHTGGIIWNFSATDEIHSSTAIAYGSLYFGSNNGKLYCLDILTGVEQWSYIISGLIQSSPAIADGKVYIGYEACCGFPSFVVCLNAYDGSVIWDYNIGLPGMQSSPAITMEKLFACSLDGIIRVFGNNPLIADAHGPYQTRVNTSLQFTGNAYGGSPGYTWSWNLGDGTTSALQNPTHIYSEEGTYQVTLIVTDSESNTAYDETITSVISENTPPLPPMIDGPSQGKPGINYTFSFRSDDPQGDEVYYWINWGDTCPEVGWIGPFASGEEIYLTHSYEEQGTFTIRAKAKDMYDKESEWSDFETHIPKPFIFQKFFIPFQQLLLKFLGIIDTVNFYQNFIQ